MHLKKICNFADQTMVLRSTVPYKIVKMYYANCVRNVFWGPGFFLQFSYEYVKFQM